MYLYRFYIDREILEKPDENGLLGGDHIRVIDIEADETGMSGAQNTCLSMLEPHENIGGTSVISVDNILDPETQSVDFAGPLLHLDASGESGRWVVRTGEDSP